MKNTWHCFAFVDQPGATERRHMKILGAGENKTLWTVDLYNFPTTSLHGRRDLEPFIGKLSIDVAWDSSSEWY